MVRRLVVEVTASEAFGVTLGLQVQIECLSLEMRWISLACVLLWSFTVTVLGRSWAFLANILSRKSAFALENVEQEQKLFF